jgi:N-acetylmuramic acid 6-phosphate etherase
MIKITEQPSKYRNLEQMPVEKITANINQEDETVALSIKKTLPQINQLIHAIVLKLRPGGRIFYVATGSGGRLSVLDVIELPTTFGIPKGIFNVILAGGVDRLVEALEEMEDDTTEGWKMLQNEKVSERDMVVGISASGTTPFVLAAITECHKRNITTGCIVSNPGSPVAEQADFPVEIITGPEILAGSTRMKCGTAQKMILDMISTTVMIQLGRVEDNRMVNMKLLNEKMLDRSVKMLMEKTKIHDYEKAKEMLLQHGSVKQALDYFRKNTVSR